MGSNRVLRGGSWNNNANNCRSANRNRNNPRNTNNNNGFRVARSVPAPKPPLDQGSGLCHRRMPEAHRPSVGGVARSGDRPQRIVGVARSGDRPQPIVGLWPERASEETTGLFPGSRDVAPPEETNRESGRAELVGDAEDPACPRRSAEAGSRGRSPAQGNSRAEEVNGFPA